MCIEKLICDQPDVKDVEDDDDKILPVSKKICVGEKNWITTERAQKNCLLKKFSPNKELNIICWIFLYKHVFIVLFILLSFISHYYYSAIKFKIECLAAISAYTGKGKWGGVRGEVAWPGQQNINITSGPRVLKAIVQGNIFKNSFARFKIRTFYFYKMLLFCPTCGNTLVAAEGASRMKFQCSTCPFKYDVNKLISRKSYPKLKVC